MLDKILCSGHVVFLFVFSTGTKSMTHERFGSSIDRRREPTYHPSMKPLSPLLFERGQQFFPVGGLAGGYPVNKNWIKVISHWFSNERRCRNVYICLCGRQTLWGLILLWIGFRHYGTRGAPGIRYCCFFEQLLYLSKNTYGALSLLVYIVVWITFDGIKEFDMRVCAVKSVRIGPPNLLNGFDLQGLASAMFTLVFYNRMLYERIRASKIRRHRLLRLEKQTKRGNKSK